MFLVFGVHTAGIIVIEVYNYFYLIEMRLSIKYGTWGLIYQGVKICVMIIDLGMVALLWNTMQGLMQARINSRLRKAIVKGASGKVGGTRDQFILISIKIILAMNALWIILRAFVRNLSALLSPLGITFFDNI